MQLAHRACAHSGAQRSCHIFAPKLPASGHRLAHAAQVYRGHEVLKTLIRAYWSPAHTTAQRYLYTGDPSGTICIYGALLLPHGAPVHLRTGIQQPL